MASKTIPGYEPQTYDEPTYPVVEITATVVVGEVRTGPMAGRSVAAAALDLITHYLDSVPARDTTLAFSWDSVTYTLTIATDGDK
jgi:hypothetical protein